MAHLRFRRVVFHDFVGRRIPGISIHFSLSTMPIAKSIIASYTSLSNDDPRVPIPWIQDRPPLNCDFLLFHPPHTHPASRMSNGPAAMPVSPSTATLSYEEPGTPRQDGDGGWVSTAYPGRVPPPLSASTFSSYKETSNKELSDIASALREASRALEQVAGHGNMTGTQRSETKLSWDVKRFAHSSCFGC
jgi:hypothetical protein